MNLDALCEVDDVPPELEHDEKVLNERVSNEILATVLMGVRPFPREGRDVPKPRPAAQKANQSIELATPSREATTRSSMSFEDLAIMTARGDTSCLEVEDGPPISIFGKPRASEMRKTRGFSSIMQQPTPCRSRASPASSSTSVPRIGHNSLCEANYPDPAQACHEDIPCAAVAREPSGAAQERCRQEVDAIGPISLTQDFLKALQVGQARVQVSPRSSLITYELSLDDTVRGEVQLRDNLEIYNSYDNILQNYAVLLLENGFIAIGGAENEMLSFALSPFSMLLEESHSAPDNPLSGRAVFSVTVLNKAGFVFATRGEPEDAERQRQRWLRGMAMALRSYTKSFFPNVALTVEPRKDKPITSRRIVAGYLLASMNDGAVSVPFCELQAHLQGAGQFIMYDNDRCESVLGRLHIKSDTLLKNREGIDCSIFQVGQWVLCAKTPEERQLWNRAISNVQVKCHHGAPNPTQEDLQCFRQAVLERIRKLELDEGYGRMGAFVKYPWLPEVSPRARAKMAPFLMSEEGVESCSHRSTSMLQKGATPQMEPLIHGIAPPVPTAATSFESLGRHPATHLVEYYDLTANDPNSPSPRKDSPSKVSDASFSPHAGSGSPQKLDFLLTEGTREATQPLAATTVEVMPCLPPDTVGEKHRPPATLPGPGLHEPPCERALSRALDKAAALESMWTTELA